MKINLKYLIAIVLVLAVLIGIFVFWQIKLGKINLPFLAIKSFGQEKAELAIEYINKNLLSQGATASLTSVSDQGNVYKIKLKIQEEELDVYISKDGRFLFTNTFEMKPQASPSSSPQPSGQEPPKAEKPDVKVFVMSYCPFGLQMEKAYLPVYSLLKDKADFGIYFVDYIMHEKKELDENLRQYCIEKEENEKYPAYLDCFVKKGVFETCLNEANVDRNKLASCASQTDQEFDITALYNDKTAWLNGTYPKFDVNKDLNEKYGVQGSPTVIINDKEVSVNPRTPEAFKNLVCQAFADAPAECSQTLSNEIPSSGIGEGTSGNSGGSCE